MSASVAVPIQRCCPDHRDWATLAAHLLDDFTDVPAATMIQELSRARKNTEMFGLEAPDALDCAELIVRQRVISATGRTALPSPGTTSPTAFVKVA